MLIRAEDESDIPVEIAGSSLGSIQTRNLQKTLVSGFVLLSTHEYSSCPDVLPSRLPLPRLDPVLLQDRHQSQDELVLPLHRNQNARVSEVKRASVTKEIVAW